MQTLKQKLSSRKFWSLAAAVAVSCMVAFGADAESTEKVAGVIGAVGACVAYMLAEASCDRANASVEAIEYEEEDD